MAKTISTHGTVGVKLTAAAQNPLTILASGGITASTAAVYGNASATWTIDNAGTLIGGGNTAAVHYGIGLVGGGVVANATAALISGYGSGVKIDQAGTVVNDGTIIARGTAVTGYRYYATPSPRITILTAGVVLGSGSVSNAAGATIAASVLGIGLNHGGSIVNAGLVTASGAGAQGIVLGGADSVTNEAGGTIAGGERGVLAAGSPATITNAGTILGSLGAGGMGVFLVSGGSLDNAGGLVAANYAVEIEHGGTVINAAGLISGVGAGIVLAQGGYVRNDATITGNAAIFSTPSGTVVNTGDIAGGNFGVLLQGTGTLDNSGTISNTQTSGGATVELYRGGSFTNTAGGTIAGHWIGVEIGNGTSAATVATTIVNAGSIGAADSAGDGADLWLRGPVYLRNTGVIGGGPFGLVLYDRSTVVNLGTITGSTVGNAGAIVAGGAGVLAATASLLLEQAPGAVLTGDIIAPVGSGGTGANTLELLSGAGMGTIAGFGSRYLEFGHIAIDPGADWLIAGTAQGLAAGTISGFAPGDTLELTGTVESYAALAGGLLTLSGGTTLDLLGAAHAGVSNDGTNTFITACFASGTKLLTRQGAVAVEALREGDLLVTAGGLAPIRWIGHRRTDLARHPSPHDVMPVRIREGAFADGAPFRDLILSPDHAVLADGALIPIRHLVNGASIAQERREHITYWHVELARHDVILAEGLACETYLDTGNRSAFDGADGPIQLHPDFARAVWAKQGCAPILTDPADPALRAVHTRLLARARSYGSSNATTTGTWSEGCALARSSRSGAA